MQIDSLSISVVIPVKDEAASIPGLFEDIKQMCETHFCRYEIIIVNDGSSDSTKEICRGLHPLKYVEFDHNYGQTAALDCGFKMAANDIVAALDGDGQNVPGDIPRMVRYLIDNNLDVVCGWRKVRRDNPFRRLLMRMAYFLRQACLHDGIHDSGCTLKVFRREALEGLDLVEGQHRFIPAIMISRGCKVGEIEVSHHRRINGESKYHSLSRIFHGLVDMYAIRKGSVKEHPSTYVVKGVTEL
ncbi:MAG: glycosyltransferase family 2 protein [Bacteroidales bacterium]|nr:glycosyltransferase family 2 protein [Bacteroidales bacterium]